MKCSFNSESSGVYEWKFYTNDMEAAPDYKLKIESDVYSDIYDETENFTIKGSNYISGGIKFTDSSPQYVVNNTIADNIVQEHILKVIQILNS